MPMEDPAGRRACKTYRNHKPSGMVVHTKQLETKEQQEVLAAGNINHSLVVHFVGEKVFQDIN